MAGEDWMDNLPDGYRTVFEKPAIMRLKTWASRCAGWLSRFPRPGQTYCQALQDSDAVKRERSSLTGHEGCHSNAGVPAARALKGISKNSIFENLSVIKSISCNLQGGKIGNF